MNIRTRISTDAAVIIVILAVMFSARLVSFSYLSSLASANPASTPYPIIPGDSVHYAHWADNILALHAYEDVPGVPLHAAPPGYPALLAAVKVLTGGMTPILVVQTLLTALAVALIYRMARTRVSVPFAAIAAFAYGMDPMVILTDTTILTDALFSALLACIVYLAFFQFRVRPSAERGSTEASRLNVRGARRWSIAGILLGAAIMLRPIGEFLVFVLPAAYLAQEWLTGKRRDGARWKAIGAFVLACALVVVPWMMRNERVFGSFEVSPLGGHNLLTYDVRGFLAWRALAHTAHPMPAFLVLRHANDPVYASVDKIIASHLAAITPRGGNRDNYEGTLAVSYILSDPFRYAYFDAVNTLPFFFSSSIAFYAQTADQLGYNTGFYAPTSLSLLENIAFLRHPQNVSAFISAFWSVAPLALEILWWFAITLLALIALMLRRRDFTVLLCAALVVYFAALTGPMSNARYRLPAEPYLLILAAVGAQEIMRRTTGKLRSRDSAAVA